MEMVDWITQKNQEMEEKYGVIPVEHWSYFGWLPYLDKKDSLVSQVPEDKKWKGYLERKLPDRLQQGKGVKSMGLYPLRDFLLRVPAVDKEYWKTFLAQN